jgi:hypothetical protein
LPSHRETIQMERDVTRLGMAMPKLSLVIISLTVYAVSYKHDIIT